MIEHQVIGVEKDAIIVEITMETEGQVVKLGLPRPTFTDGMLDAMAIALGDIRYKDAARNACEDLFVESWVRHCRSRVSYWAGWWDKTTTGMNLAFPLALVLGNFIPKCSAMGTNSEMRDQLRGVIANAGSTDENGSEEV